MFKCKVCSQAFVNKSNLNRHVKQLHDKVPSDCESGEDGDSQTKRGDIFSDKDESDTKSDPSDDDAESADDEKSEEDEDENDVYARFLNYVTGKLDDTEPISHKRLQKLFRKYYMNVILWFRDLEQHPIHRKVMKTAQELRNGPDNYDYKESLEAAMDQRKHLLNRLVPDPEAMEEEEET